MVLRINDNRIGIMSVQRRIVQQFPSYFASGGYWNRQANPTPTTVYFGPDNLYFYVLPVGIARINSQVRQELEQIVNEAHYSDPQADLPTEQPVVSQGNRSTVERQPSSLSQAEWGVQSANTIKNTLQNTGGGGLVIGTTIAQPVIADYPEYDDILPDVEE